MRNQLSHEVELREVDGEGKDDLKGTSDKPVKLVKPNVPSYPLYHEGSAGRPGITTSTLYPGRLGESVRETLIADSLDRALQVAHKRLGRVGKGLMVVSGYISPTDQQARFAHLFKTYLPNGSESSPAQIMDAGIQADNIGSVASVVEDEAFEAKLAELKANTDLCADLAGYMTSGDIEATLKKYLTFLANAGWVEGLSLDIETATTVHNLAHSANIVLTDRQGNILPTGRALDVPSSTQAWNKFEEITHEEFLTELRRNQPLQQFMDESNVDINNPRLIEELRMNNRALFNAVMRGSLDGKMDVYKDEGGSVSIREPEYPNQIGIQESLKRLA